MLFLIPSPEDFSGIAERVALVKASPASYHIGAKYLTGNARADYNDKYDLVLGRLGTFARVNYKSSTLVKSPHLSEMKV